MTGQSESRSIAGRIGIDGLAVLLGLAVALVSLFVFRDAVATLGLRDSDDYMRLAQVRDLMAGQSWFDVTQYRVNPAGGGGLMHWSRFIDIQIAGLTWLLTPLLGPAAAERWAVAIYPPMLIMPLFLLLGRILLRLGDRRLAVAGLIVAATGVSFLHYFVPLRIDHHNWQLLLSVAMLWLALGRGTCARGIAAALVITAHLEISLEGFPYLIIFGALFALDWLRDARTAPRLAGFAGGLVVVPTLWLMMFRGPQAFLAVHCDAFTRPYVAGVAAAGALLFAWASGPAALNGGWLRRAIGIALAAAAGAGLFLVLGQTCLSGPFGELEPLVRTYWYDVVREGQPVWRQSLENAVLYVVPTLIGLGATLWAWTRAAASEARENWLRLGFVALGSAALSMLVFRTSAATHAYLVPGFAAMALMLWDWSRARGSALGRVGAGLLVLTALPAVDAMLAARLAALFVEPATKRDDEACPGPEALKRLAARNPALIFAPIDLGPSLLVRTPHSVIATSHHRNHAAMDRVITAFLSEPETAKPIVGASGATWLLLCTKLPEIDNLATANPQGLAARLVRGESVDWLEPEPALSRGDFAVYRIVR